MLLQGFASCPCNIYEILDTLNSTRKKTSEVSLDTHTLLRRVEKVKGLKVKVYLMKTFVRFLRFVRFNSEVRMRLILQKLGNVKWKGCLLGSRYQSFPQLFQLVGRRTGLN